MQGYFHANKQKIGPKVVEEFDKASKGQHGLPQKAGDRMRAARAKRKQKE
jgi:hypothetical protein